MEKATWRKWISSTPWNTAYQYLSPTLSPRRVTRGLLADKHCTLQSPTASIEACSVRSAAWYLAEIVYSALNIPIKMASKPAEGRILFQPSGEPWFRTRLAESSSSITTKNEATLEESESGVNCRKRARACTKTSWKMNHFSNLDMSIAYGLSWALPQNKSFSQVGLANSLSVDRTFLEKKMEYYWSYNMETSNLKQKGRQIFHLSNPWPFSRVVVERSLLVTTTKSSPSTNSILERQQLIHPAYDTPEDLITFNFNHPQLVALSFSRSNFCHNIVC